MFKYILDDYNPHSDPGNSFSRRRRKICKEESIIIDVTQDEIFINLGAVLDQAYIKVYGLSSC